MTFEGFQGMLWFDNGGRTLVEKILGAKEYFTRKMGVEPNRGFVSPGVVEGDQEICGVKLSPSKSVLPNHIWLGRVEA